MKSLLAIKRGKKFHTRKPLQNFVLNFSFLLSFINYSKLLKKLDSVASKYPYDGSKNTMILVVAENMKNEILPKSIYDGSVNLEFENQLFSAPNEYKKWLEHFYGDYMTPPPAEKRISQHASIAYYKD